MIINFSNLGGGGSPSSLPIATTASTGVVKIGEGINVDSAGTISVEEFNIPVVESLPASGTDGEMVLLETIIPEKHIHTTVSGYTVSTTAVGITTKTFLYNFEYWGHYYDVYVNTDNSITIKYRSTGNETDFAVGETDTYILPSDSSVQLTVSPTSTGLTITTNTNVASENYTNIDQVQEERQVLYTWSDVQELTSDIIYTVSSSDTWCVKYKYSEIPNNTTLLVLQAWDEYLHFVYKDGDLIEYKSASADTYTATTGTSIAQYGVNLNDVYVYWTDDEIIFVRGWHNRTYFNINGLYKTGWHKNLEHKIDNKAFYKDYTFYDGDYQLIIRHPDYPVYSSYLKINPENDWAGIQVYSTNNGNDYRIFAPTTTGQTGYVCVAGNGWTAPTWVSPETITNGVKFWKGTQSEYDAMSGTGYDNSTLYIITDDSNVV